MTDLIERLRDWQDYVPAKMFGGEILKDVSEAAAEIERLHAWRDAKNEACVVLEKENEQLRAAVEDAIDTLEAMDLHVDNPLYERLTAAMTNGKHIDSLAKE